MNTTLLRIKQKEIKDEFVQEVFGEFLNKDGSFSKEFLNNFDSENKNDSNPFLL